MWENNPYYNPENMGLETVAELEFSDGNYQFDTLVVWKHTDTNNFYSARDSGCSCPTPFEAYDSLDKLTKLDSWDDPELMSQINKETEQFIQNQKDGYYWGNSSFGGDAASFLSTVRYAMLT